MAVTLWAAHGSRTLSRSSSASCQKREPWVMDGAVCAFVRVFVIVDKVLSVEKWRRLRPWQGGRIFHVGFFLRVSKVCLGCG